MVSKDHKLSVRRQCALLHAVAFEPVLSAEGRER